MLCLHLSLFKNQNDCSPEEKVKKLNAMFANGIRVNIQLSPLVSMKSWRVMAVGSIWCSLKGLIKAWQRGRYARGLWEQKGGEVTENQSNRQPTGVTPGVRRSHRGRKQGKGELLHLPKNGQVHRSPRVSSPVDHSRGKVCRHNTCNWTENKSYQQKHQTCI